MEKYGCRKRAAKEKAANIYVRDHYKLAPKYIEKAKADYKR